MKKNARSYWFLVLVGGLIILADVLSKNYIRNNFEPGGREMWAPWAWMLPYARILFVENSGVAFGMFQGMSIVFAVLAVIVALAIVYYFPRVPEKDWSLRLAMGLQFGGAMGNLIDRLQHQGHVTDFISLGNFPVFNVADSAITIGVIVLLLSVWLQERQQKKALEEHESQKKPRANLDVETPDQTSR